MADVVTRIYGNFRGVDFRGEEINLARSPDSLNMWKDYKETDSIRTRPGMELVAQEPDIGDGDVPVYYIKKLFEYRDEIIVLTSGGKGLYRLNIETGEYTSLIDGDEYFVFTDCFAFGDSVWITESFGLWKYTDGDAYARPVEGYIPTTSHGRKPDGGGEEYEQVNLLTGWRRNTFAADGVSTEFHLDAQNIDTYYDDNGIVVPPRVKVNGQEVPIGDIDKGCFILEDEGVVKFVTAPAAAQGEDNVEVEFYKMFTGDDYNTIGRCDLFQVFDNRVFASGNDQHPNRIWHCKLNDPSYWGADDHEDEGGDSNAAVTSFVAGNNALWVFREPSNDRASIFYHTPTIDSEYDGMLYPSTHSNVDIGCVGKGINFNDDIVFFSERGMEGINGDVTTEQVVAHRSSLVDRKMIAETDYKRMLLQEWQGYLLVIIGKHIYLADSRAVFTKEDHNEYEWFYWEMSEDVLASTVIDGELYLATRTGIYKLTDTDAAVESYWVTPKDKFQNPNKQKTTNKRGCVAEATGDITLYAKTENTAFEPIGTFENVTDYFVGRIKRKKFKDIQLKFYSPTRFSLESVTLECFIGGYVKR